MSCRCGNENCPCGDMEKERELFGEVAAEKFKLLDKLEHYLHSTLSHPEYKYTTTAGDLKTFVKAPSTDWERNTDYGKDGWQQFALHQEAYWKKKL